jgi:hypothetical protein
MIAMSEKVQCWEKQEVAVCSLLFLVEGKYVLRLYGPNGTISNVTAIQIQLCQHCCQRLLCSRSKC